MENKQINFVNDEIELLHLADDMASAASTFNAHGYDLFIRSRDSFKETLHKILVDAYFGTE